jgi:predicted permease
MVNLARSVRAICSRFIGLLHPGHASDDFTAELESHIAMHVDDGIRAGLPPEEARRQALIWLGGIEQTQQRYRERRSLPWIENLIRDIRYGLRGLAKNLGFTGVAVLTLALGIGVTSTIFAVADAALLRSWPAKQPERLVRIIANTPQGPDEYFSFPESQELAAQGKSLEGVLAYSRHGQILHTASESRELLDEVVSPNYFSLLGTDPKLGLRFDSAAKKHEQIVVISNSVWQRFFGADPQIIGKQISLTGSSYTVIGIAPPGFRGLSPFVPVELWVPLTTWGGENNRAVRDFELLGRLRPGVTAEEARVEIETIGRRMAQEYPALNRGRTVSIVSERQRLREAAAPTLLMMAAVGMVLLICCANVAGLILARSDKRRKEIAMRLVLGATRGRLIRQLLTESLLLAVAGAVLGLLLAVGLFRLQPALMPPSQVALGLDLHLDSTLVLFTMVSSTLAVVIFGLTPALQATRRDYASSLKRGETGADRSNRRLTLRNVLVVVEIALAATLLTASSLVLRSLLASRNIDLGFDRQRNLIFFDMSPNLVAGYTQARITAFFDQVEARTAALPGVEHVGLARRVLLSDTEGGASKRVSIPGVQLPQGQPSVPVKFNAVDANYFQTMGTRILEGRAFAGTDSATALKVVVISRNMANRFWPAGSALSRQIVVDGTSCIVVGVAENAKINQPHEEPEPYLYLPFAQWPSNHASLIVDGGENARALIAAERGVFRTTDRNVPYEVRTIGYLMRQSFWIDQTLAGFVSTLGVLAIFLGAIGLYGVIAYLVNRRTREIGIRMAFGAERRKIIRMVLRQGLVLAGFGAGLGSVASLLTTRLLASQLYGVKPTDPLSFAVSVIFVALVALAACWIPARRAASVDPMQALRVE